MAASMVKKLPCDLEEEILSRLPPRSLVRSRVVCKQWNSLLHNTSFLNNHLSRSSRPQFIFLTESKIYSIDIIGLRGDNPTIDMCELPFEFPCQPIKLIHTTITTCNGLLFREFSSQEIAVWNPWLRQVGWIDYKDTKIQFCGVGYSNKGYKILGYFLSCGYHRFVVYECASQALKFIYDAPFNVWSAKGVVPLSGNLFWIGFYEGRYLIQSFDFCMDRFVTKFCLMPCEIFLRNELALAGFKGDRLSLLKQCHATGKIVIWVTSKMIEIGREEMVWINLMTFQTTNLPKLVNNKSCGIKYFIFDKTLIMCCGETGAACVYIVRDDMFKQFPIESGSVLSFSHCVYVPNLIPLPLELRSMRM